MQNSRPLKIAMRAALVVSLLAAFYFYGTYRWYRGFYMGADAALCVVAIAAETPAGDPLRERPCGAIRNRTPPWPLFPDPNDSGSVRMEVSNAE